MGASFFLFPARTLLLGLGLASWIFVISAIHFCIFTIVYLFSEGKEMPTAFSLALTFVIVLAIGLGFSISFPIIDEFIPIIFGGYQVLYINPAYFKCIHSWSAMKVDWASSGAACDFVTVKSGANSSGLQVSSSSDSHTLGSLSSNGDTYYVCNSCQAVRCSKCHAVVAKK